jgi:ribose/xylose/arabinose/galactoside ABC-type transport system permease subunit
MYETLINQETIITVIALGMTLCLISGVFELAYRTEKIGDEEK